MGKSEKSPLFTKDSSTSAEKINQKNQENYKNQPLINIRYDTETIKNIKPIPTSPKINIPFGSSSIKSTLQPTSVSENPGPGSYDIELDINKNILSTAEYSNKFFITGDTRFKSSKNNIPGVGEYNIINTSINNNKNNLTPKKISKNVKIISHDFKSPRRIPTIPDRDTKFGFGEDKEGKMEMLTDPCIDQKFDGTKSNSIGPDRYNALIIKHNNALNWEKASKKNLEIKTKNKTDELYKSDKYKYINSLTSITGNNTKNNFDILTDFYNYTNRTEGNVTNFKNKSIKNLLLNKKKTYLNKSLKSKNIYSRIYKNENLGFKENYDTSYIDLTSVPLKKKTKVITPGPGAYDPNIGNFNFEPKKNKFQNFGTYESRNMFPIPRIKNYKNFLNSNTNNFNKFKKNRSLDDKSKLNKFEHSLHNLRINLIKEQSMKNKTEIENKMGPGKYSPELYYNLGNNIINNINKSNFERKEDKESNYITINENPGVGEYDVMGEVKKEIDHILFLKKSKENKDRNDLKIKMDNARKIIKKKKENKTYIRKEYKETEEYRIRQQFLKNYFRPAFDSAEPKFKKIGNKDDSDIAVGSYDLIYPMKKIRQIKAPFLNGSKKWSDKNFDKNGKLNPIVGPGTYEQRSFFDWNKKSFNVQYKLK